MTVSVPQMKADVEKLLIMYTSKPTLNIGEVRELMEWAFMKGAQREIEVRTKSTSNAHRLRAVRRQRV